jgi:hypothetical protein
VDIPDFQEDLPVEANHEEEFIAAMIRARDEDVPIQVFQDPLKEAPPVSVVDLYLLTVRFLALGHTNVVRLLLEHEPKVARYKNQNYGLLLHRAIRIRKPPPVDTIELILDA